MTGYFVRVREDGRHQVYMTTDGRDRIDVPSGVFGNPRDAVRYAEMREANVQPVRDRAEGSGESVPRSLLPARSLGRTTE